MKQKAIYVRPKTDIIILNLRDKVLDWGIAQASFGARAEDAWAKKHNFDTAPQPSGTWDDWDDQNDDNNNPWGNTTPTSSGLWEN